MFVYLSVEGQEQVALGHEPNAWQLTLSSKPIEYEGFTGMLIGEVEVALPSRESCIEPVLAKLKAKEQEIQAEAYKELQKIKDRRESLLCLEAPANA
jgi:hypothetical protein